MTGIERSPPLVSLGITTRNRPGSLLESLEFLRPWAGELSSVIVVDDGSEPPLFGMERWKSSFRLRFVRKADSQGLIVRRNEIIRECETALYLSLDDDSFPVSGSIELAAAKLLDADDLFAVSFPFTEGADLVRHWQAADGGEGYTQCFVGCAHMVRVDRFLELGGYRESLVHQHEEREISLRAWKRGWRVRRSSALEIHHRRSSVGRDLGRAAYWNARNDLIVAFLHFPLAAVAGKVLWYLRRSGQLAAEERRGLFAGVKDGLRAMAKARRERQPLSWREFNIYRKLPFA